MIKKMDGNKIIPPIRTKQSAVAIFKTQTEIAKALGLQRAAISRWPENLSQRRIDEITGAAVRLGLIKYYPRRDV